MHLHVPQSGAPCAPSTTRCVAVWPPSATHLGGAWGGGRGRVQEGHGEREGGTADGTNRRRVLTLRISFPNMPPQQRPGV